MAMRPYALCVMTSLLLTGCGKSSLDAVIDEEYVPKFDAAMKAQQYCQAVRIYNARMDENGEIASPDDTPYQRWKQARRAAAWLQRGRDAATGCDKQNAAAQVQAAPASVPVDGDTAVASQPVVTQPASSPLQSLSPASTVAASVVTSDASSPASPSADSCESAKTDLFHRRYDTWKVQVPSLTAADEAKARQWASGLAIQSCAAEKAAAITGQPSFACAKASSKVEHLICDHPDLAVLDVQLQSANQLARFFAPDKAAYARSAQSWLKSRDTCRDVACITAAYRQRLAALEE